MASLPGPPAALPVCLASDSEASDFSFLSACHWHARVTALVACQWDLRLFLILYPPRTRTRSPRAYPLISFNESLAGSRSLPFLNLDQLDYPTSTYFTSKSIIYSSIVLLVLVVLLVVLVHEGCSLKNVKLASR
jgi:hypothetical protein